MNNLCDLYLPEQVVSNEFKHLRIFDKSFMYVEGKEYSGYVGVAIQRIKMLSVIVRLREKGINAYSVPIDYRETKITKQEAFEIACILTKKINAEVLFDSYHSDSDKTPLFWIFSLVRKVAGEDAVGAMIRIDRVDGHEWSMDEFEKYMHDYNHILI